MSALVIYHSESGNTQKLAQAVATGLGVAAVSLESVDMTRVPDCDLICVGTPVQYGGPSRAVRKFIARMPAMPGKRAAAFCTMHASGDAKTIHQLQLLFEAKGMVFLGGISARGWSRLIGRIGPRIFNRGRPNQEELAGAEAWGRSLLSQSQPLRPADVPVPEVATTP